MDNVVLSYFVILSKILSIFLLCLMRISFFLLHLFGQVEPPLCFPIKCITQCFLCPSVCSIFTQCVCFSVLILGKRRTKVGYPKQIAIKSYNIYLNLIYSHVCNFLLCGTEADNHVHGYMWFRFSPLMTVGLSPILG